ncbi:MAG: phosphonoacetaldehyde hydrolase [Candidatus Eremiobacteraeota bacterium]|nr:phosphonoacetaldehyde hydrolase [Candidatus Eremiobacteraeota bacterium]
MKEQLKASRLATKAVIFDWAGTAVDFGSIAPVQAMAEVFKSAKVPVSVAEIRRPMGMEKRRHIQELLGDEQIAARWHALHGSSPTQADVNRLYDAFNEQLIEILPRRADPIPGLLEVVAGLRAANIKIGSNSGYSARMMDVLSRAARERGYEPDCVVSSSDVQTGRPAPDLSLKCLEQLGLSGDAVAIKVDDTSVGIEEGGNAGLWTVAVAVSGNEVGLSLEEWLALTAEQQAQLRNHAYERLNKSLADYVIDTVADLATVVCDIEMRIAAGERRRA